MSFPTDVRCWICRDDFMRGWEEGGTSKDGLPYVKCPTCGAIATITDCMRIGRQQRVQQRVEHLEAQKVVDKDNY